MLLHSDINVNYTINLLTLDPCKKYGGICFCSRFKPFLCIICYLLSTADLLNVGLGGKHSLSMGRSTRSGLDLLSMSELLSEYF